MDSELVNVTKDLIGAVGVPAAVLFGMGFLGWKLAPQLLSFFNRVSASLEKIADSMGGMTTKQDELRADIRDLRQDVRDGHKELKDLLSK